MDNYALTAQRMKELQSATAGMRTGDVDLFLIMYLHSELTQLHWSITNDLSDQFCAKESAELARKNSFDDAFTSERKGTIKESEIAANDKTREFRESEIAEKSLFFKQQRFLQSIEHAISFCMMCESKIAKQDS